MTTKLTFADFGSKSTLNMMKTHYVTKLTKMSFLPADDSPVFIRHIYTVSIDDLRKYAYHAFFSTWSVKNDVLETFVVITDSALGPSSKSPPLIIHCENSDIVLTYMKTEHICGYGYVHAYLYGLHNVCCDKCLKDPSSVDFHNAVRKIGAAREMGFTP